MRCNVILLVLTLCVACTAANDSATQTDTSTAPAAVQQPGEAMAPASAVPISAADSAFLANAMAENVCGSYPNCASSACSGKKMCNCRKDDKARVCSPTSCYDNPNC